MGRPSQWTCRCVSVWLVAVVLGGGIALGGDGPPGPPGPVVSPEEYAKAHPQDYRASLNLADVYIAAGRFDDAEREIERAETLPAKADDHTRAHIHRSELLLRQGKVDEGVAGLRAAADNAKFSDDAWAALRRLSEVLLANGRQGYPDVCREMISAGSLDLRPWSEAMLKLAAYLGRGPETHAADWEAVAALAAFGADKPKAPGPTLAQAVEAIPPDSPAYPAAAMALCGYYTAADKLDLAARAGERAVKLDPDHWMGHWLLALCLDKQGKTEDALGQFKEMARTAGRFLDLVGVAAQRSSFIDEVAGRLDLAMEEHEKAVYGPRAYWKPFYGWQGDWEPHHLVSLALRIGKAKEALAFFQKNREELLLAVDNLDPGWLGYNVAVVCAAVGDRDGMVANLTPFAKQEAGAGWEGELLQEMLKAPDPAGRDILLAMFEKESSFPPDQIRTYGESAVAFAPDLPGVDLFFADILAPTDPARASIFAAKALEKAPAGSATAQYAKGLLAKLQPKVVQQTAGFTDSLAGKTVGKARPGDQSLQWQTGFVTFLDPMAWIKYDDPTRQIPAEGSISFDLLVAKGFCDIFVVSDSLEYAGGKTVHGFTVQAIKQDDAHYLLAFGYCNPGAPDGWCSICVKDALGIDRWYSVAISWGSKGMTMLVDGRPSSHSDTALPYQRPPDVTPLLWGLGAVFNRNEPHAADPSPKEGSCHMMSLRKLRLSPDQIAPQAATAPGG